MKLQNKEKSDQQTTIEIAIDNMGIVEKSI
jgi:hypothetical protein